MSNELDERRTQADADRDMHQFRLGRFTGATDEYLIWLTTYLEAFAQICRSEVQHRSIRGPARWSEETIHNADVLGAKLL